MSRLRVHGFSMSIDGYGACPNQNGIDNDFVERGLANIGHLVTDVNMVELGYDCTEYVPTPNVTHIVLSKRN